MRNKVLFVDDENNILQSMRRNLASSFEVITAQSADEALVKIPDVGPFKVIVSDYRMPGRNGLELLTEIHEKYPNTILIMLTGQADFQAAVDAINQGILFRFLLKPFPTEELKKVLFDAFHQHQLVQSEKTLLQDTLNGAVKLMVNILAESDPDVYYLASQVRKLAKRIALRLKFPNIWEIELAASLCQIGTLAINRDIVKAYINGRSLTHQELEEYYESYQIGSQFLSNIPRLENIADGIYYQGKNYDGSGVPADDKSQKNIPVIGRLIKVAQDFYILLNKGLSSEKAFALMKARKGIYDPDMLAAMEAEFMEMEQGYIVREVPVIQLRPGYLLAEDVVSRTGVVLLKRKTEITNVLLLKLTRLASERIIPPQLKVLVTGDSR